MKAYFTKIWGNSLRTGLFVKAYRNECVSIRYTCNILLMSWEPAGALSHKVLRFFSWTYMFHALHNRMLVHGFFALLAKCWQDWVPTDLLPLTSKNRNVLPCAKSIALCSNKCQKVMLVSLPGSARYRRNILTFIFPDLRGVRFVFAQDLSCLF